MHPVPVELDLVQPLRPFRRRIDQFGELRLDPIRQRQRLGAPPSRKRSRHVGIRRDNRISSRTAPFPG
jgi:hypothetical protein